MTSTMLTYVFDAYCGWCHGFAPALHELAQDDDIEMGVISGAPFSSHHAGPLGALAHIPGPMHGLQPLPASASGKPAKQFSPPEHCTWIPTTPGPGSSP